MDKDYSNHTPDAIPGLGIPLTDKQLIYLGRLTAMWGQIDFFIDFALTCVFNLSPRQTAIVIGEKPVGAKVQLLKRGIPLLNEGALKSELADFVSATDKLLNERNHACHGVWAWRANSRSQKLSVSARAARSPSTPLRPDKLKKLVARMAECSRLGVIAFGRAKKAKLLRLPLSLRYGPEDEPPKWLSEFE